MVLMRNAWGLEFCIGVVAKPNEVLLLELWNGTDLIDVTVSMGHQIPIPSILLEPPTWVFVLFQWDNITFHMHAHFDFHHPKAERDTSMGEGGGVTYPSILCTSFECHYWGHLIPCTSPAAILLITASSSLLILAGTSMALACWCTSWPLTLSLLDSSMTSRIESRPSTWLNCWKCPKVCDFRGLFCVVVKWVWGQLCTFSYLLCHIDFPP